MVAGQRNLRGPNEIHVVGLEVVDLVGVRAEEAGALHHFRAHQHRRDHQREAVLGGKPHRELHDAELQQRAEPGEEGEARTRHLGAALHVDQAERFTEFQVVLRVRDGRRLTDRLQHDEVVLAAGGNPVDDDVADRHVRGGERRLGDGLVGFGGLDLLGQFLGARQQGGPLIGRRRTDGLAGRLLFGTQVVGGGDHRAALGVGVQQRVDEGRILAAGPLRRAHPVGVFT